MTDEIHSQATRLSQLGYHVVVPELYRGKLGVAAEEAEHLMGNLNWEGAVADVRNAAKYLRHMCGEEAPAVMSQRLAVPHPALLRDGALTHLLTALLLCGSRLPPSLPPLLAAWG